MIDRRHSVASRERHDFLSLGIEKWIVLDDHGTYLFPLESVEVRLEICFAARIQDEQTPP